MALESLSLVPSTVSHFCSNIQLAKNEVRKFDQLIKTDDRIKKLMFYHVKFEDGAVKSFSLSNTTINHLLFVNCTMRNEDRAYLSEERKPGEIHVTVAWY